MKEATLASAHVAESFQPTMSWKRVIRTVTGKAFHTVLTIIRHEATPWVLTGITTMVMLYGYAIGSDMLYKSSAAASIVPFAWGLLNELKNTNTDEL